MLPFLRHFDGSNGKLNRMKDIAKIVRRLTIAQIYAARSGHPGGALSATDLMTYLYFRTLKMDPKNPDMPERDRFILSKGHSCPALYAVLGLRGCLGADPTQAWKSFRKLNGLLQGHPDVKRLPWVETSTGSLGQGFSVAVGMALGLKHIKSSGRVFVMLGDGEQQEGEVWEAVMAAAHHRLDNLCVIIDYNKMQSDALNEDIMGLDSLRARWQAFNWPVIEIDGHDFTRVKEAFSRVEKLKGWPVVIIAHTIKGKGVSFMEGSPAWHGSVAIKDEEFLQAMQELDATEEEIKEYQSWRA